MFGERGVKEIHHYSIGNFHEINSWLISREGKFCREKFCTLIPSSCNSFFIEQFPSVQHQTPEKDSENGINLCLNFMAGHLLFEMMCGYELTTLSPSNSDMANVNSEAQVEVSGLLY